MLDEENDVEFTEIPGQIPSKIKFRTAGDTKLRERKGPIPISDIAVTKIDWFWYPYIPLGRLSMLSGDPGAGKSFITTAISATLSKGGCFPGDKIIHEPGNTLMLAVEDDPADTIRPRLQNMRADLTRIFVSEEDIVLDPDGLNAIRAMIKKTDAKLVIIDPIVAFLGPKMDMNRANEVRHIMKGLARIAREFNIAILVVRHNRKEAAGGQGKAIYAGMGSIDFTASVRSELSVTVNSKNGLHFMNHIKTNSGVTGLSITYTIEGQEDGSGLFTWGDLILPTQGKGAIAVRFKDEAVVKAWLHDQLKDTPEGLPSTEIFFRAKLKGWNETKLKMIKKGIVSSVKVGTTWYWKLDTSAPVDFSSDSVVE